MITPNAQIRAVLGSLDVITCHKLPSISIESLHFHCTRAARGPPLACKTRKLMTSHSIRFGGGFEEAGVMIGICENIPYRMFNNAKDIGLNFNFEWDPAKAKANLKNHRVGFDRATEIFMDPMMLTIFDEGHSESEDRWITLGKDRNNVTLVVIHTFKDVNESDAQIRIISARRATKKEDRQYHSR
jgi:uncharacterized protein